MELVDTLDGFAPVRPVMFFDPPSNEARPRAALEPVPALGQGLSMDASIRISGHRLEISPDAQRHRELVESTFCWYTRGRKHRPPRMLPCLHVSDGSCEEPGAPVGSRIHRRYPVDKTLHNRVANGLLQDGKCEERDSRCHACTSHRKCLSGTLAPGTLGETSGRVKYCVHSIFLAGLDWRHNVSAHQRPPRDAAVCPDPTAAAIKCSRLLCCPCAMSDLA